MKFKMTGQGREAGIVEWLSSDHELRPCQGIPSHPLDLITRVQSRSTEATARFRPVCYFQFPLG